MSISTFGLRGADGFNASQDLVTKTIDGVNLNTMWAEFQATLDIQNSERQTIVDLLTFEVKTPVERVMQGSSGDFERATEFGVPRGQRGANEGFYLGYDFGWYDRATRYTWQYLAEATAQDISAIHSMVLDADNRLIFRLVMEALYRNTNRKTDINTQPVDVYALYNADGTVPPPYKTHTFTSTHNHYMVSGANVVEPGDLDDIYTQVAEHGYGKAEGSTNLLLVNSREGKTIRGFKIANGAAYDFIPAQDTGAFLLQGSTLIGSQPANKYQGLNVIGAYGDFLIIEDDLFPAGYITHVATGGAQSLSNPVGLREHADASLRGLRMVQGNSPTYPLIDAYYMRGAGTGIRQRGGAAVMQIKASGNYVPPTF